MQNYQFIPNKRDLQAEIKSTYWHKTGKKLKNNSFHSFVLNPHFVVSEF